MREDRAVALPRFRLRTLLVALAVLALLIDVGIESERLLRRASYYRYWARMHGLTETTMRRMLAQTEGEIARCKDPVAVRARCEHAGFPVEEMRWFIRDDRALLRRAAVQTRQVEYHAKMRKRFEEGSWRPWLTIRDEPMPD